ncbi:MAG TPA: hypothetical protein VL137_18670 [Polyangiaceae bacterium]|nr:hypothetical protein [Polyangiaceae bacterium]
MSLLAGGCSGTQSAPTLPEPDVDLGLGDVVLLTWTTRAQEGLLGYALEPGRISVDSHRRVVEGEPRFVPNAQKMHVVVSNGQHADVHAGIGLVSAGGGAEHATHVEYDVTVTGYLELAPEALHYLKSSGCCINGNTSTSCGEWYVVRLMRGSGKAQYLQKLGVNVDVQGANVVRASGGTTFQRLNEMSFEDTYFAYEVVPLSGLCTQVPPDEELEAMSVQAPPNCWAQVVNPDGTRNSHSWYLQSQDLCAAVARNFCKNAPAAAGCHVTYGGEGQTQQVALSSTLTPTLAPTPTTAQPVVGASATAGAAAPTQTSLVAGGGAGGAPAASAVEPLGGTGGAATSSDVNTVKLGAPTAGDGAHRGGSHKPKKRR